MPLDADRVEEVRERPSGAAVTASTLRLIGVRPVIGRMFEEADEVEGAPPVMLISFQTWQQRVGGDPAVVGAVLRANGVPTTVAGILPEGFEFPYSQQIWQPLRIDPGRTPWGTRTVRVIGRLRDGTAPEAASQDLNAIAARLAQEHPETNAGMGVHVERFGEIGDRDRAMLFIMLAAVAGVLITACVNVTNLLIGRWLVIAEIALSAALLVGAGLVVRSANALNTFDLGVDADAVFIGHVELPAAPARRCRRELEHDRGCRA
ncbi:MAG TPA: ABC transporter permease [Longimicrobiales bacterium]|nr:ABC transporter permease [Longimicrobiales bacterium]